jgi:hypothetical protein
MVDLCRGKDPVQDGQSAVGAQRFPVRRHGGIVAISPFSQVLRESEIFSVGPLPVLAERLG